MPHGGTGGRDVVDGDVVVRQVVVPFAEQDQRHVVRAVAQVLGLQLDGAEDESVDDPGPEALAHQELLLARTARVVEQHDVVVPRRRVDDRGGQFGEVRVPELRQRQGDDARTPLPQVPGGEVGLVAERVDGPLDTLAHGRGDVLVVVHHVGDGLDADPRVRGDVLEADPHGNPFVSGPTRVAGAERCRHQESCAEPLGSNFFTTLYMPFRGTDKAAEAWSREPVVVHRHHPRPEVPPRPGAARAPSPSRASPHHRPRAPRRGPARAPTASRTPASPVPGLPMLPFSPPLPVAPDRNGTSGWSRRAGSVPFRRKSRHRHVHRCNRVVA